MSGADTGGFRGLLQAQAGFPASDVRGLKVLGRGTPQQGAFAESAGPKPSRNANPSVAPGRAAHPPRGWGLLSPKGAGRGRRNGLGAGGRHAASTFPPQRPGRCAACQVPELRAGTDVGGPGEAHGPGWWDFRIHPTAPSFSRRKRPTCRCCGCCRLLTLVTPLSSSVLMAQTWPWSPWLG